MKRCTVKIKTGKPCGFSAMVKCSHCSYFVEKQPTSLKLYIWDNTKAYDTRVYFALATSEEQARELIIAQTGNWVEDELKDYPAVYDYPVGFEVTHSG